VEVCRSRNTTGWFIAINSYKGFLLIMGIYMAWETRHVKIPSLDDSGYIGICVYSVVSSAIVVVLSNLISDYTTLSYLATALSILLSTTITLVLLFFPKLRAVLGRVDGQEDAVTQSMGLKTECNTRRFMLDDHREILYRMEVQNRVYKNELQALDKEIARLEEQIANSASTSSISESPLVETISNGIVFLPVPFPAPSRASWPSTATLGNTSREFLSENKLHLKMSNDNFMEKLKICDRLKRLFGSIPSVWISSSKQTCEIYDAHITKPCSSPEFYKNPLMDGSGIIKAKSAISSLNYANNKGAPIVTDET
ncbi:hypothetical protein ILUMI_25180, partial [Ignelater luminosus]